MIETNYAARRALSEPAYEAWERRLDYLRSRQDQYRLNHLAEMNYAGLRGWGRRLDNLRLGKDQYSIQLSIIEREITDLYDMVDSIIYLMERKE